MDSNTKAIPSGSILAIKCPPKIWRPKAPDLYVPIDYSNDIDDDLLIHAYENFGKSKTAYKSESWNPGSPRTDLIKYDAARDDDEIKSSFKINPDCSTEIRSRILSIIHKYWDCFCKRGVSRPILGFEFGIDTGASRPVCCRKPQYGFHEKSIIMDQVEALKKSGLIEECQGPWGSLIVLAPKPHQEHVENIDDFIWRMCVSYRKLNSVTKPFSYPIPRCDDAIDTLGPVGSAKLYFITLDARQGYHQIAVKKEDREKLAFFAPDDKKYTYRVMPFGPTNAPAYYTFMMRGFQEEWTILFIIKVRELAATNPAIRVDQNDTIFWSDEEVVYGAIFDVTKEEKVVHGSRSIIDDILLWCNIQSLLIVLLECVCEIFLKYRVSFRLDKCEFFMDRVEYVGHDITAEGNCPAKSKFNLVEDWKLPDSGESLHSFIGLINFYHRYIPYFEMKIKPLRRLEKVYRRSHIPLLAWTEETIRLFHQCKEDMTSSPVLQRYDPEKICVLKTDWSAEGMGWILLQPANDKEAQLAMKTLEETLKIINGEVMIIFSHL